MTPTLFARSRARKAALAYLGLTTADAALGDLGTEPTASNCRLTLVPGRLLLTPHRQAKRHGLEAQEYAWPAIALIASSGRFGTETSTLVLDVSGELRTLHVEMEPLDLRWALSECGFRVVDIPHAPVGRAWVPRDVQHLLPVSLFA